MDVDQMSTKRGRPRQTPAAAERARARIVAATAAVFAEHGSFGSNVALIIERAGIARPTFYRYFGNAGEPLELVLDGIDDTLTAAMRAAAAAADDPIGLGAALIDAYLDWALDLGPMMQPIFAELYHPASPVAARHTRALDRLRTIMLTTFADLGLPAPSRLALDTLLHACSFAGYRVCVGSDTDTDTTATIAEARATMLRLAAAILDPENRTAQRAGGSERIRSA